MNVSFSPRVLTFIKGHDLENVTTLRTIEDAQLIAERGANKDVLIIGTSFIGEDKITDQYLNVIPIPK